MHSMTFVTLEEPSGRGCHPDTNAFDSAGRGRSVHSLEQVSAGHCHLHSVTCVTLGELGGSEFFLFCDRVTDGSLVELWEFGQVTWSVHLWLDIWASLAGQSGWVD